jgi:hypothetical protein
MVWNEPGPAVRFGDMRHLTPVAFVASLALLFTVHIDDAHAEHGMPLLLVKPGDGAQIPRNARIRLVSYNGEDELIWLLGNTPDKVRARLVSSGSRIPLRPVRYIYDPDGYGRAMISLAPRRLLEAQTEYELVVDVPSADWSATLASFVTTEQVDRDAPRWGSRPVFEPADRMFVGRLAELDDIVEVDFIVRPVAGGRARRTFVLFDQLQECIEGPTVDYRVAIFNSQCVLADDEEGRPGALCDTLYYFPGWRHDRARYVVRVELRDLAGNVRRLRSRVASIDLLEPFGVCLEI